MNYDENTPVLTLNPMEKEEGQEGSESAEVSLSLEEQRPVEVIRMDESTLTPEERKMVDDFSKKINITDSNMVMLYGADAQRKMADFSGGALANVRTKDLGEIGGMITSLIGELKGIEDVDEPRGLFGRLKKGSNRLQLMKVKYDKAEVNVEKITGILQEHQVQLFKDIAILDKLYDRNLVNFKELTMYIIAGKKKLHSVRENELKEMIEKAKNSGLPEDAQAANDLAALCDRFDKKLHDLELTRVISIQMAPQIRLVQNNDTLMAEKIQSTIVNTIPLWKSQMVIAMGLAHSQQALQAQREVTNMTNELLRRNADALKMGTLETAREAERGVVDIETLKYTNEQLISTLDEVVQIQAEGRQKRREAEAELGKIEGQLKQKLLDIRN
ncbi:MAG: toxic anion resistance protein [Christensenellales bacterium]|jgi:uncharacterized protein YaaN involved in tellurite resistance